MAKDKKTISFVATEDIYNRVKALFPDSIGRKENLIKLLDAFENSSIPVDTTLVDELQAKLKDNEASMLTLTENNQKSNVLLAEAQTQIETLEKEIESLKSNNDDFKMAVLEDKKKNYLVPKSKVIDALMELTVERLTEKLKQEITPAHIFTDMFLRYTIEKKARWFYPFVISDAEIKEILK